MSLIDGIVAALKRKAETGINDDVDAAKSLEYLHRCTLDVGADANKGVRLMYTRSIHEGEHFLYLSMHFRKAPYTEPHRFDHRFAKRAAPAFFGVYIEDVMVYPPQTDDGKRWNVWHFRLFTSPDWKPTGYRPASIPDGPVLFTWLEYAAATFI